MFLYIFAKYLVSKQSPDYEISIEIIFLILTVSLLLSVSRKLWNWLCEYNNYIKDATKTQEIYYDEGGRVFNADECPICVSKPINAVKTNCGHCFCGLCFQQFYKITQKSPNRYKCPLCRRIISNIQRPDKANGSETTTDEEKIDTFLKEYHDQFNRHKRASKINNITSWLFNLFIGSLFLLTVLSPLLYSTVKKIIFDFYTIFENYGTNLNDPIDDQIIEHLANL